MYITPKTIPNIPIQNPYLLSLFPTMIIKPIMIKNIPAKYIVKASPIMFALSRSYQKLPSFVADLSGILEEVLGIILLTVNILERQAIDNKLIKKMMKIYLKKLKILEEKLMKIKIKKEKNIKIKIIWKKKMI